MIHPAVTIIVALAAVAFGTIEHRAATRDARAAVTTRDRAAIRARLVIAWLTVALICALDALQWIALR